MTQLNQVGAQLKFVSQSRRNSKSSLISETSAAWDELFRFYMAEVLTFKRLNIQI